MLHMGHYDSVLLNYVYTNMSCRYPLQIPLNEYYYATKKLSLFQYINVTSYSITV